MTCKGTKIVFDFNCIIYLPSTAYTGVHTVNSSSSPALPLPTRRRPSVSILKVSLTNNTDRSKDYLKTSRCRYQIFLIQYQQSKLIVPLSLPSNRSLFRGNTDMQVKTPLKVSERSLVLEKDASWSIEV